MDILERDAWKALRDKVAGNEGNGTPIDTAIWSSLFWVLSMLSLIYLRDPYPVGMMNAFVIFRVILTMETE